MKHLLMLPLLVLALSCGKPYDFINGDPKVDFTGTKRQAIVEKPFPLSIMLTGRLPAPNQPLELVIKVDGEERLRRVGQLGYNRVLNGVYLKFSMLDYYNAIGRIGTDNFGRPWVNRFDNPDNFTDVYGDELQANVTVELTIWLVDVHPTKPDAWVRISRFTHRSHVVRLACPQCPM